MQQPNRDIKDIFEFRRLFEAKMKGGGGLTTSEQGRRLYNRLYLKFGGVEFVYRILGLNPMRKRKGCLSISEAEQVFVKAFTSGEVTKIRDFAAKYTNAARLLRRKYRYLSEAARQLLPNLFLYKGKIVVTKEEVVKKLKEIVKKHGKIVITDRDGSVRGAPSKMIMEAVKFYFKDLENAAKELNLPYKKHSVDEEIKEIVQLLLTVRETKENTVYRLMKIFGNSKAIRVYRYLKKLGDGDYQRGLQVLHSLDNKRLTEWVSSIKGGR